MQFLSNLDASTIVYALGIYSMIILNPGPNFTLVSKLSLQGRRRSALGATIGFSLGATFYAVLAMVGLAALLEEFGWLAKGMQILGGLYLIFLGVAEWRESTPNQCSCTHGPNADINTQRQFRKGLKLGLVVELSNPQGIAFFIGLYAAAVPPDASIETRLCILVGGAILELLWYGGVSTILSQNAPRTAYLRYSRYAEKLIGSALILFGAKLIADS